MKAALGGLAALCAAVTMAVLVVGASGDPSLTRAEYVARLRVADARSLKAENRAMDALQSAATAAQVRARFFAMGRTHVQLGRAFAALTPPRVATRANADYARAEVVYGRQTEAIARALPATKPAIANYLQSLRPPSGGRLVDRAVAELNAAGFEF